MKPLVSILIPAYNSERWIGDTLRSALGQSWERKEIIVVDDGSRDGTLAVAEQFTKYGVQVVSQANKGAAAARNQAYALCSGDYIQWLDADDLLSPDKISLQMAAAMRSSSKSRLFSSSWGAFLNRYHTAKFVPSALWHDLSPKEWLLRKLGQNLFMQTATWLVSRELTESVGQWDTRLLSDDDGEYFSRVLLASDGVEFVPGAKVYYRMVPNSLSYVGTSDRKRDAHLLSMQLHIGYLRSLEDTPRVRQACVQYLQNCLIYFYPERSDIVEKMSKLATELGGELKPPSLKWKYKCIKWVAGWRTARHAEMTLQRIRWSLQRSLDEMMYRVENRKPGEDTLGECETARHPIAARSDDGR